MTAFAIPGAVEAEDLVPTAKATSGGVWSQDMGNWDYGEAWSKRAALFWQPEQPGADLTIQLPSKADGRFQVMARMVSGPAFGVVQLSVGGAPFGEPVDLYSPAMSPKEVSVGVADLKSGSNPITVRVTGKNTQSGNLTVGIDAFTLTPSQ
jgi:hypothetical protein